MCPMLKNMSGVLRGAIRGEKLGRFQVPSVKGAHPRGERDFYRGGPLSKHTVYKLYACAQLKADNND